MKINNINSAFDITKKVIEELGEKIEEKIESVHVHNPSSEVEGLFEEPNFDSFAFKLEEEEEIDCRDVLWLKDNSDSEFQQFLSIGKEPSRNCWSMEWGLYFDCDSVKREFGAVGDEDKIIKYVLAFLGLGKMPLD